MSLRVASSAENSTSSVNERARRHGRDGHFLARLAGDAELERQVEIGRRDERVDAAPARALECAAGLVHVARRAPRERRNDRALHFVGYPPDRLRVVLRGNREARLDDVDAENFELTGQTNLFLDSHREPGRLFTVTQRRVENDQPIRHGEASVPPLADKSQGYDA